MRLLAFGLLAACGTGSSGPSGSSSSTEDSRPTSLPVAACPADATSTNFQLTRLGYVDSSLQQAVFEDQATVDAYFAAATTTSGGPTPGGAPTGIDFGSQVLFAHPWVDGGCEDPPTYAVCVVDAAMSAVSARGLDGGCDAFFPNLDLLLVDRGAASSFAWAP